ncbi:MAG: hypothetical protein CM15mP31_4610 [Gammaproteobacteria bacterium]|nr:MAG: hypothetical protein CM15mP31_4610 [Gammaproteobacteria bacterium]
MGGELEYVDNTTLGKSNSGSKRDKLMAIKSDKWIIEQLKKIN